MSAIAVMAALGSQAPQRGEAQCTRSQRQLAVEYKATLDWSSVTVALERETYTSSTRYDALNRPIEVTAPDNSLIRPTYNEANLLERLEANVRGAAVVTLPPLRVDPVLTMFAFTMTL